MRGNRIIADTAPWMDGIGIFIGAKHDDGSWSTVSELNFEPLKEMDAALTTLYVTREAAQALMDSLWNCGLRPAEAQATESHVDDLRRIAFKLLKIS